MGVWRRCGEAASAVALYSVYHGLYSEAVVSSAVALAEVGRFGEAVEYVQRAAKALYEAARDVFEQVKITVQRLVELFVEAVARVLAWVDEHKAYLFLMAAVAAGAITLSAALNMWGLIELDKLAYAASLTPFVVAGVKKSSTEEAFKVLREAPDPYEKFKEIAKAAVAKNEKLAEPWKSLRVLIQPTSSEEKKLMSGRGAELYSKYREDENYGRALFYAALALEEAFGVYKSALGEYAEGLKKAVRREEVGEELFKKVMYVPDLGQLKQLAEEESKAFEHALKVLREGLNEYAVRHGLRDLLDVKEGVARGLAEAKAPKLSEFGGVNFGVKAYVALIAYREYALGRWGALGAAVWYWLEVGGSARLLYYAPVTAYIKAKKAEVGRPVAVEEVVAEALRRLFLKPGADHYRGFVELLGSGRLALMLEREDESSYVFKLYNMKEGGELDELGVKLRISKVGEGEGIVYTLELNASWREFFAQKLEAAEKAAEQVGGRLPVEDLFSYMVGWVDSDVAIARNEKKKRVLAMGTSHLWQLAETHALFGWSNIAVSRVSLTLEGPKPQFDAYTSLGDLDKAIRRSARDGWLKRLGVEAGSWDGLKRWVSDHWDEVIDAVKKQLKDVKAGSGFYLAGALEELEELKSRLDDDKIAREVIAPALLLIQAERLGVNETTLRYFGAVISGAIGGDGYVSAAMGVVGLTSGEREIALLWGAVLAAYGIEAEVRRGGDVFQVIVSGVGAARLAGLYFLYGPPLLEGDEIVINHKLAEAMEFGAEGLSVSWEGLRRTPSSLVAADLIISEGDTKIKYNVYLLKDAILIQFVSTDRSRAELAARLLKQAGVGAEMKKVGERGEWHVWATTDRLAVGREELRKALAEIVREAIAGGWIDAGKAERWLEELKRGRVLREGWPKYHVGLAGSGALEVKYQPTDPDSIVREVQRLREMGLEEGVHFSAKMPEEGRDGYVYIRREGLAYAAWLSVYGSEDQRKLAAEFIEYILQRAWETGEVVYEKAKEIIEEGMSRGSLKLEGFEKKVEVDGRKHVVKVIGGSAEFDEGRSGKKLLRIRISAEVDGVVRKYEITFSRREADNKAVGFAVARADAPGGREADAERLSALIKALTGREPKVYRMKNGAIIIMCGRKHLDGFMRYAELADAIEKWLKLY